MARRAGAVWLQGCVAGHPAACELPKNPAVASHCPCGKTWPESRVTASWVTWEEGCPHGRFPWPWGMCRAF